jgi:hypothetical protein
MLMTTSDDDEANVRRDLTADAVEQARRALAAFEALLGASAGRSTARISRVRGDLKKAAQRASAEDAAAMRNAGSALSAEQDTCAHVESVYRTVAADLLKDFTEFADVVR